MKVNVKGIVRKEGRVEELVEEILANMAKRIGVPEGTQVAIEDLEFKVIFSINGEEQYATVPREINGETVNEMFNVVVHLDENGNVKQAEDNEDESFYDGYTLAQAVGQEYQYEGTESSYDDEQLEEVEVLGSENVDVKSIRYTLKSDPEIEIVRHYKGDLLVAEYEYRNGEQI